MKVICRVTDVIQRVLRSEIKLLACLRSRKSWDIQQQNIINGEAFLVTVKDNGLLIGGGLFSYTKFIGTYSVGAYKRELFGKPIGHGVQMKAIEFLKEKDCQWYEIGRRYYSVDKIKPTEKELKLHKEILKKELKKNYY